MNATAIDGETRLAKPDFLTDLPLLRVITPGEERRL